MLGRLLYEAAVTGMQYRIDDIMLGKADVDYDRMVMQLEGDAGEYDGAGDQSRGFKKDTLYYRVIYGLEYDPLFLAYLQRPLFGRICEHVYGPIDISTYRAFVMNKPANGGSSLQWHQDRWNFLEPDPLITVWTALDTTTVANGCVQIIPGSHRWSPLPITGLAGGMDAILEVLDPEQRRAMENPAQHPVKKGECSFHHPLTVHGSTSNLSGVPRRATVVNLIRDGVEAAVDEPLLEGIPAIPRGDQLGGQFFPLLSR